MSKKSLNTMHFSSDNNKMVILQHGFVLKIQRKYIHAFESCTILVILFAYFQSTILCRFYNMYFSNIVYIPYHDFFLHTIPSLFYVYRHAIL